MTFYLNCPLQAEANYEEVLRQIYKTKWMKHFNKEKLRMLVRWTLLSNTTVLLSLLFRANIRPTSLNNMHRIEK